MRGVQSHTRFDVAFRMESDWQMSSRREARRADFQGANLILVNDVQEVAFCVRSEGSPGVMNLKNMKNSFCIDDKIWSKTELSSNTNQQVDLENLL